MTSSIFSSCAIELISISNRQRSAIIGIKELKDSISRLGLIHPIVIDRQYNLIAGNRRLEACRELGWTSIPFQFVDDTNPDIHFAIELEENIKRKDLSWQDRTNAIAKYHNTRLKGDDAWSLEKTAAALGIGKETIYGFNPDHSQVSERVAVAKALEEGLEIQGKPVSEETDYSTALNLVQRYNKLLQEEEEASIGTIHVAPPHNHILHSSFEDWVITYDGPKFNLIHCDFPYGIDFEKMGSQAGSAISRYEDDFESYKKLTYLLCTAIDQFAEDSCHLIFWFSMRHYKYTYDMLSNEFTVDPFPLIWNKSDNSGILPDSNRGPRRTYETAFFASRGDRVIVRAKANIYSCPVTKVIHPHEKPQEMLEHFLSMVAGTFTSIFDPTAGSGTALRAAKRLGATRLLGLEINPDYVQAANAELNRDD